MTYTINLSTGVVIRDSDQKAVAPTDNPTNADYVAYTDWVAAGNSPTEIHTLTETVALQEITKFAFRKRFTQAEKVAIDLMSIDSPSADISIRQQQAALRVSLADQANAEFISLVDTAVITGVHTLVALGVLTAVRATEILTAPIADDERWHR